MPKKSNKIKVVYRKLGRERAYGQADDFIELDPRLKGKKHCEILVHEAIHVLFPHLSEKEVIEKSILLTNTLWHEKYRRIEEGTSHALQDGTI